MLLNKALSMENNSWDRNKGSTNRSESSLVVLLLFEIMSIHSALLWTSKGYNCTIHDRIDVPNEGSNSGSRGRDFLDNSNITKLLKILELSVK